VPALPPYLIEPIWEQLAALLPERERSHPLGCHRPRIPDRVVFEKLVQVLVFGCAYEKIADERCSATTLRRRRDEWILAGVVDALREMALEAYDRMVGLELSELAVGGAHQLLVQRPQEASVVHGAAGAGGGLLGRPLGRRHHRQTACSGGLESLPLGGTTFPSTMTYWRKL